MFWSVLAQHVPSAEQWGSTWSGNTHKCDGMYVKWSPPTKGENCLGDTTNLLALLLSGRCQWVVTELSVPVSVLAGCPPTIPGYIFVSKWFLDAFYKNTPTKSLTTGDSHKISHHAEGRGIDCTRYVNTQPACHLGLAGKVHATLMARF